MRRYPLQPLLAAARMTLNELRLHVHINGTQYRQILDEGLSERQADRWAVKLGLLPVEVWPELVAEDMAVAAAAAEAVEEARREAHRAADRRSKAKRRQDPEVRAREAEYLRQYRASERARETARRYRRAYYQANRERELARQREYDARRRGKVA